MTRNLYLKTLTTNIDSLSTILSRQNEQFKKLNIKLTVNMSSDYMGIKIAALLLSFSLSICSVAFAVYLIYHLRLLHVQKDENGQTKSTENANTTQKYFGYFASTSQFTAILNILCCFTVTTYCILIMIDSEHDLLWFIALRATVTVCWFSAKASLIWLYNGRLYYAFIRSALQSSYALFISLNVIIALSAPLCLIMGFVGVYNNHMWMISVGFEGFRFIYLVLTAVLLVMFTKRLLTLQSMAIENKSSVTDAAETIHSLFIFVNVASKNAVLVLFIAISALLVFFAWTIHDYATSMSYLHLLLPLLMFSVDSVATSFCICLLFNFAKSSYQLLCKSCDGCCKSLCVQQNLKEIKELELQITNSTKSSSKSNRTQTPSPAITIQ